MEPVRRMVRWAGDHPLPAILGLAFLARLGLIVVTAGHAPAGDALDYHRHGVFLAEEGRYPPSPFAEPGSPSAFRPPAYPYLLGLVYEVAGLRVGAGRAVGGLLGLVSVGLLYLIALELWGRREAALAGLLAAVYPPFVLMSGVLLAENLFVPLVLGTVLALLRARGSPGGVAWWAAAGALASAASLTRTNGAVLLVLVLTLAGWAWLRGPRPARVPAVALAAAVLVLVPWTVRNMAVFDSLVPLSTQTGFVLAGEYNLSAAADGPVQAAWRLPQFEPEYRDVFFRPGVDEAELDRRLRRPAATFAADHPRYALEALRLNLLRTLESGGDAAFRSLSDAERDGTGYRRVLWVGGFWALAALAAVAVLAGRTRRRLREAPLWLWLVPVVLLATTVVLVGNPRYRLAADPFLVLAAATLPALRGERGPG